MMAMPAGVERRTEKLDIRIAPSVKAKLQAAAAISHCSVSDFILASALARAEDALADRRVFHLDDDLWDAFRQALDAPPRPMPRMAALLSGPDPFQATGE